MFFIPNSLHFFLKIRSNDRSMNIGGLLPLVMNVGSGTDNDYIFRFKSTKALLINKQLG